MSERNTDLSRLRQMLTKYRVVGMLGARQVGISTLANEIMSGWEGESHFFDLENPEDEA